MEQAQRQQQLAALNVKEAGIRLDFKRANDTADKFDEVADSLIRLQNGDFEQTQGDINASWAGENANMFLNKYLVVREEVNKSVKDLKTTAETIRRIAKNTYDAEMNALQIARTRIFNS